MRCRTQETVTIIQRILLQEKYFQYFSSNALGNISVIFFITIAIVVKELVKFLNTIMVMTKTEKQGI